MANEDVFGQAIHDYFQGQEDARIMVHSELDGLQDIPVYYLFRSLSEMPMIELEALKACEGRVLELGAGAGSHALELQEMGYSVIATDNSSLAVEVMQKRGISEAHCLDYLDAVDRFEWDTLLMLMNGIGLVGDLDGLRRFLRACLPRLDRGAQIICDSSDIHAFQRSETGAVEYDNSKTYQGELRYSISYGGQHFSGLPWLYIDLNTLISAADSEGIRTELIAEGDLDNFLVRLSRK